MLRMGTIFARRQSNAFENVPKGRHLLVSFVFVHLPGLFATPERPLNDLRAIEFRSVRILQGARGYFRAAPCWKRRMETPCTLWDGSSEY